MVLELIKTYKYIVLSWLILIVYLLMFSQGLFDRVDQNVYSWLISFQSIQFTQIMKTITFLGSWISITLICLICIVIYRKQGLIMSINIVVVSLFNAIIKNIVMRQRPRVIHLVIENGYSFPSAHAMISFALFGWIVYMLYRKSKLSILLLFIPVMISITRIYLGVHYFSDVMAGMLFAVTYLCSVIPYIKYHKILSLS